MPTTTRERKSRCYIFLLDGARYDIFAEMLAAGRLPNVQKFIVEPGTFRPAVTTFPSTTGPAHIPFLTGQFAGTSDVLGYRWLDRKLLDAPWYHPFKHRSYNSAGALLFAHDMNPRCTTLYEMFRQPALVMGPVDLCRNKKLTRVVARRIAALAIGHYTGKWEQIDRVTHSATMDFLQRGADFIFSVFLAVDEYSHYGSPFSEETKRCYERADATVGAVAEWLARRGELENSVLAVVSDHGHSPTETHVPVVDRVKAHGFSPLYYPKTVKPRFDMAVMESGNSMCMLYAIDRARGTRLPEEDLRTDPRMRALLDELIESPAVPFLAMRNRDGWITLRARGGSVMFRRTADGGFDVMTDGGNILDGLAAPAIEGVHAPGDGVQTGHFTDDEMFRRSLRTGYPDLLAQYGALFESRRCGDVVLASRTGFDLRLQHERPEHLSSHGSNHWEHMLTPLAINVPLAGSGAVRTADVYPIVCEACGLTPPADIPIDGRSRAG